MSRTLLNERFLPSLLDRLSDDDPVNRAIDQCKQDIEKLNEQLAELDDLDGSLSADQKKQQAGIKELLDKERAQYAYLSSATGSLKDIRECVKRDLDWLFNSHNFSPASKLERFPEIKKSVLNYGLPDYSGSTVSSTDIRQVEKSFKQVILDFEPRIIPRSLHVKLIKDESKMNHNALTFEIEGDLWAEPVPIYLHLRTELELENGSISIRDA